MSPAVPRGTPIGRIETSLDWLLSHTTRFQGAIVVRISGGKGLILIEYGRPAAFLCRLGERTILGEAAWRYFAQHDFLRASLHRYTDQEFREAMNLVGHGARILDHRKETAEVPPFMNLFDERQGAGDSQSTAGSPVTRNPYPVEHEPPGAKGSPGSIAVSAVPDGEHLYGDILGRLLTIPGVSAAAFFREGSIIDSLGDRALGAMVEPAEEVLLSAFEVLALLSPGPLVQVTIQLFGSNVTISPYNDGYLLVLTYPEFNLGQIRKLMHDVAETGMV